MENIQQVNGVCCKNVKLFNILKLMNITHHINRFKKKYVIFSINSGKALYKFQQLFLISFSKLRVSDKLLNMI